MHRVKAEWEEEVLLLAGYVGSSANHGVVQPNSVM